MIRLPRQPGSWHWDRGKRPFRAPAGWAFRPVDFQPVLATADPGGEGIRHCPPAPWFATVWFPMRNGPPPWLIKTRVHGAHYYLVWRSAARAHAKIFKVLHHSSRLEIRPEIENTSHHICRLNIHVHSMRAEAAIGTLSAVSQAHCCWANRHRSWLLINRGIVLCEGDRLF